MADSKLVDLTADASPTGDDLIYVVNDPGGTPADRKVTLTNLAGSAPFTGAFAPKTTAPVVDVAGTSDTIDSGDLGKILRYTDAGLVTVTLPDGIAVGSIVNLLFWGAAGGAIQDNGTSTVQPEGSVAQYGEVSCVVVATNTWSVQGNVT